MSRRASSLPMGAGPGRIRTRILENLADPSEIPAHRMMEWSRGRSAGESAAAARRDPGSVVSASGNRRAIVLAGDLDGDDQAGIGVEGGDVAVVELDGAAGDRQSQADAAAGSVAVPLDAEERLEDVGEGFAGTPGPWSRTAISACSPWRASSTSTVLPGGACRIALRRMFSLARRSSSRSPATTTERSPVRVSRQPPRRPPGRNRRRAPGAARPGRRPRCSAPGSPSARVSWSSSSTRLLSRSASLRIRQGRFAVGAGLRQLDGESQPGQRRAELVRDVLEQPSLGRQQRGDLVGHAVEGLRQLADLVATRQVIADSQVAPTELLHDPAQAP